MVPRTRSRAVWWGRCQPWHIPDPLLASAHLSRAGQSRVTQVCTEFLHNHSNFKVKNARWDDAAHKEITTHRSGLSSVLPLGGAASTGQGCTGGQSGDRVGTALPPSPQPVPRWEERRKYGQDRAYPWGTSCVPPQTGLKDEIELPDVPQGSRSEEAACCINKTRTNSVRGEEYPTHAPLLPSSPSPLPQNFSTNIGLLFFNSKTLEKWGEMVNCASPVA